MDTQKQLNFYVNTPEIPRLFLNRRQVVDVMTSLVASSILRQYCILIQSQKGSWQIVSCASLTQSAEQQQLVFVSLTYRRQSIERQDMMAPPNDVSPAPFANVKTSSTEQTAFFRHTKNSGSSYHVRLSGVSATFFKTVLFFCFCCSRHS